MIALCAAPNALPFASKRGERRGTQIDLAEAIAKRLGVALQLDWVVFRSQYVAVDCDLVMDVIVEPEALDRGVARVELARQGTQCPALLFEEARKFVGKPCVGEVRFRHRRSIDPSPEQQHGVVLDTNTRPFYPGVSDYTGASREAC